MKIFLPLCSYNQLLPARQQKYNPVYALLHKVF